VTFGVFPRMAAALSTLQMALFGLIVWVPRVVAGAVTDFQWGEFVVTCALTAAAWVVTDSYRNTPWLAPRTGRDVGESCSKTFSPAGRATGHRRDLKTASSAHPLDRAARPAHEQYRRMPRQMTSP
jgi:hypothetical protein